MKKVGIVVDNYKVERIKKELIKANFTDFTVVGNLTKDTTVITINVEDKHVNKIGAIVSLVETHFKRSN
jgi:uncharacterized protein YaaQ